MLPTALTLHNYRSFAGPQRLEIRPLTLLFGENNAGKSALLRSLPLLADSVAADGLDALNLGERLKVLELDFGSLRWKGRAPGDEHTVGIDLHWAGDPLLEAARFAFWEEPDWHRLLVQQLTLIQGGGAAIDFEWIQRAEERRSAALRYRRSTASAASDEVTLEYRGLVPSLQGDPLIEVVAQRLKSLSSQVMWLRSLRPAPQRTIRWSGSVRWELEPLGTDAAIVLAGEPDLLTEVSGWYDKHLGLELTVAEGFRREVRVAVRNKYETGYDVDLVDTGEGLSQVLPVLTALAMADLRGTRGCPAIVAIEEPEAHLHSTLQQALAERVCEVAARTKPRIVLETHSRSFLLAVQRSILRGAINEQDVIMYWVRQLENGSSVAEPVTLDALARLRGAWPSDAFDVELEREAEIQDLRDEKERA